MLEYGLIVPSNSEIGSPLHVVPKVTVQNYASLEILSKMLTPDKYPLPNLRAAYELSYGSKNFPQSI